MSDESEKHPQKPKGLISWMAGHAIAGNLLMALFLFGGFWTAFSIQKEVFPEFSLDLVNVSVSYPGSAPAEVEQGILLPIEEAIRGIESIRQITSEAREGGGTVSVELVAGADRTKAFQDIDQAVARITTFPNDAEEPEVVLEANRREVMEIVIYGNVDIWTLRTIAEQLRDQLLSDPDITQVELGRAPAYVTHIEIPRDRLREYGFSLADISEVVANSSENVAAGSVYSAGGEILLRMNERKQVAEEFSKIKLVSSDEGTPLLLGDIATIRDGFEEEGFNSQFNQQPSVELNIYRVGEQSPLRMANVVEGVMADFEADAPPGVSWRIDSNAAEDFRQRVSLVVKNGAMAVIIVVAILALFLELRLAFWVMMGMVISFFGGFLLLPMVDLSVNMISLFGFLIVLGVVVDDAIVVGENVYEHRQSGDPPLVAAIRGAREMALPVTISILSNIVAFIPLMLIPGETGKFWEPLPYVVVIVLAVSLFEALFILPGHLGHQRVKEKRKGIGSKLHGIQQGFSKAFSRFVDTKYRALVNLTLRFRYVTATVAIASLVIAATYATSAHMGMILMPEVAADEIEAGIRLPVGTTPEQAASIAGAVTTATLRMIEERDLWDTAEGVKTNVRRGRFVDVEIVMKPPETRRLTTNEVIALWRDEIGELPGVSQIDFEAEAGPAGWSPDVAIDLSHNNVDTLELATRDLVSRLESYANTRDVYDNFNRGKAQLDITLLPEGRALGLTPEGIGRQVRAAFYGELALRMLRGTNEVEIRVKLPRDERQDIYNLEDLVILTPDGVEVPLTDVVEIQETEAFASINRRDGRRVVNVSCDVEPKRAVNQIITALNSKELPELRSSYPGLTWSYEGNDAEMREATESLKSGFVFAILIIYALLAVTFGSYFQPLIVLSAIPFGIVGAVAGHMLLGYDLSIISLMGVIALSGVVVNDSLIMVSYANQLRRGSDPYQAVLNAGIRRFRPIVLTTLTTFGGLTPIILEKSLQAQYLIPMAISLGFGIVFATGIILLLVPCLYLIVEDFKKLVFKAND